MPFRITPDDQRAAKVLSSGSMDGARAVCGEITVSSCVGTFAPLERAHETYQQITAAADDQGVREKPDENDVNALFQGTREEAKKKGCFRCEHEMRRHFFGAFWIRHDGDKHYIVFTDVCGNTSEEGIFSCPWCKRDFEEDGDNVQTSDRS